MTLIAAVKGPHGVIMGGDSLGCRGSIATHFASKLFWRQDLLMGVSGNARWLSLLKAHPDIPSPPAPLSVAEAMDWFNVTFAAAVQAVAKNAGLLTHDSDGADDTELNVLIAYRGELYTLLRDLSVEHVCGWDCETIGTGREVAKGVLYALRDRDPMTRLVAALDTAAELLIDVGPPFTYEIQAWPE